jgi:hypothetical protein
MCYSLSHNAHYILNQNIKIANSKRKFSKFSSKKKIIIKQLFYFANKLLKKAC